MLKPYSCHRCGRLYQNKGSLNRHLDYECGQPAKYICEICLKGFKRKTNYQRHVLGIHGHVI